MIAPPVFVITASSLDREEGVRLLTEVNDKIRLKIESFKGRFKVKMAPKVVTDLDEAELARQMEQMEAENEQVAGDTDSEEDGSETDEDPDMEGLKAPKELDEDDPKMKAISGLMENAQIKDDGEEDPDYE